MSGPPTAESPRPEQNADPQQTSPTKSRPSLDEVYDRLADRPAEPLFRSHRRRPPTRKPVKVAAATTSRHTHVYDAAGFCQHCQEHRGYLEAAPTEPLTPSQVLGDAPHAAEPTDDEWLTSLLDTGPPDGQ